MTTHNGWYESECERCDTDCDAELVVCHVSSAVGIGVEQASVACGPSSSGSVCVTGAVYILRPVMTTGTMFPAQPVQSTLTRTKSSSPGAVAFRIVALSDAKSSKKSFSTTC